MFTRVLILILSLGCSSVTAQVVAPGDSVPASSKKQTVKVSVIDPAGKKKVAYNGHPILTDSVQKAVKLDPTLLVRGEFTVFYEWRLSRHFSVEGGLGLTYVDLTYELFQNNGRFIINGLQSGDAQFNTGFAARGQFRFFPAKYESAIGGFYVAPAFAYRTWHMDYFVSNGLVSEKYQIERQWTEVRLQIGEQDPDPYSVLFTEWYLNFGLQFRNEDRVRGQGVTSEIIHRNTTRVVFGAGVKIGFVI
jgi:hypothetical protein